MCTHKWFKHSHACILKLNLGCSDMEMGKLNQWKICIGHSALLSARKIITHECTCINVLSLAMIECWNQMNQWNNELNVQNGDGKTEPMENLHQPCCTFKCKKDHYTWMYMHKCFKHSHDWVLKPNLGCSGMVMGKMNQWNICIGHYALLSAERSSCMNVHM